MSPRSLLPLVAALLCASAAAPSPAARAQGAQTVLGPGMYVFQTRTRSATCDDDEATGYVSTFIAPVHGVPGSREMRMTLTNSQYWPTWQVTIDPQNRVTGEATLAGASGPSAPRNRFTVSWQRDRFVGTGARTYRSSGRECRVEYDALLRQIDLL